MGKRDAEPELTRGNEACANPGKTWGWGGRRREAVIPAHDTLHYRHSASEAAGLQEAMTIPNPMILFIPGSHTEPLRSFLSSFYYQWGILLHAHLWPGSPGNCIDTNFNFFVKNALHSCGPSRWPDLKAGGPAMALTHKMWMTGGNKSLLVHELHRKVKAISFSSWGEQNSQSSSCWDLHIIFLCDT